MPASAEKADIAAFTEKLEEMGHLANTKRVYREKKNIEEVLKSLEKEQERVQNLPFTVPKNALDARLQAIRLQMADYQKMTEAFIAFKADSEAPDAENEVAVGEERKEEVAQEVNDEEEKQDSLDQEEEKQEENPYHASQQPNLKVFIHRADLGIFDNAAPDEQVSLLTKQPAINTVLAKDYFDNSINPKRTAGNIIIKQ